MVGSKSIVMSMASEVVPARILLRPAHDTRDAQPAFPACSLALAQRTSRAGVIAVAQPGPVVGREDDERILRQAVGLECPHDLAHRRVDFLDHVAIQALARLTSIAVADMERHVRHRVREVKEEGLILVTFDKGNRSLGVEARQPALVVGRDLAIDDPVSLDQGKRRISAGFGFWVIRPHVVGVGQPEVFIKPVMERQEARMMSEMPLAGDAGRVPSLLEQLGHRRLAVGDAVLGAGAERAVDADPVGVAAGQQRRARGRANRLRDVEVGEPPPFARQAVEVRRHETLRSKTADVTIALVVSENDHNIGQPVRGAECLTAGPREKHGNHRQA